LFELRELGRDPEASMTRLAEFAEWLTLGLINVVNLLGPQLVILGDLLTVLPEAVLRHVGAEVRRRSLVSRAVGGTRIVSSALGADGKLLGAAEVAFEVVLDSV
jgi:predicted NBD/HSP70 family sugar kinase